MHRNLRFAALSPAFALAARLSAPIRRHRVRPKASQTTTSRSDDLFTPASSGATRKSRGSSYRSGRDSAVPSML